LSAEASAIGVKEITAAFGAINNQLSKQIIGFERTTSTPSKSGKLEVTTEKYSVDGWTLIGVLGVIAAWEMAVEVGSLFTSGGQDAVKTILSLDPFTSWLTVFMNTPEKAGPKPVANSAMAEINHQLQIAVYQTGSLVPGLIQKLKQGAATS
jgi:hypothetical protein